MKTRLSFAAAAVIAFAGPAAAQMMSGPTVDPPPPTAVDAMSNGIGERVDRLREELREAYAGGRIGRTDAEAIERQVNRIGTLLSYHNPRGYHERKRLRAQLDSLEVQIPGARR